MKITVIHGIGKQGIPDDKYRKTDVIMTTEIDVPEGSKISDVWEAAKIAINLVPYKEPIINRQEMPDAKNNTIVVPGSTGLNDGDTLYLVFVK